MDDANIPSLLAMPLWNYSVSAFKTPPPLEGSKARDCELVYNNTRNLVLSDTNPYFMRGPVISAVGGPHVGPGKAWPMAAIIRAMTALREVPGVERTRNVEEEVRGQIMMVLNSTAGTGGLFSLSYSCPFFCTRCSFPIT